MKEEIKNRNRQICINLAKALEATCQENSQQLGRPAVLSGAEFSNTQVTTREYGAGQMT
jgi:hypothetical protein